MWSVTKRLFKRLPYIETLRSFMEQWGIWAWLIWGGGFLLAAFLSVWAFVTSHLPMWAVTLVFLGAFALLLAVFHIGLGVALRARAFGEPQMQPIDRLALADEAELLARNLGALLADHTARMIVAREKDSTAFMNSTAKRRRSYREKTTVETAKTMEKFVERYLADIVNVISRARKVVHLQSEVLWHLSHMSDHDLHRVQFALVEIANDLRHAQPALPTLRELERSAAKSATPQLPLQEG